MSYVELMNEKSKIAAARAELDEQERKLDIQIKLASASYAETLFKRMCAFGEQIEELGYRVIDIESNNWIDFDTLFLVNRKAER